VAAVLPSEATASDENAVEARPTAELADIQPLGSDHFNKVLTRKMMWLGNIRSLFVLVGFIGGLALLAWGASILDDKNASESASNGAVGLCSVGGLLALFAVGCMLFDMTCGGNRMLRNRFRAELSRRSGLLVDPMDPEAVFVEVVPKLNWGKAMLDNASDIGLLVVDRRRRELRFEGDKERWRVPAASITNCTLEAYVHGQGEGATKYFYVVLRANRRDGFWEAPIRERHSSGVFSRKRKKLAEKLFASIKELTGDSPTPRTL
jgi:hypothetical protein